MTGSVPVINVEGCRLTAGKPRILCVDDEIINLQTLADTLKDEYKVILAKSGQQALYRMKNYELPDLILLDIIMHDMSGYKVLKEIKSNERTSPIPVIFITVLDSDDDEEKGLSLGAVDYITKPFSPAIVRMRVKNHLHLRNQTRLLEELSQTDFLTRLPNRRHFKSTMERALKDGARKKQPLSLALVDVDYFKSYNDTYGHTKGDNALEKVACALNESLKRPKDFIARYGGEEFVVILPETEMKGGCEVAKRLLECIEQLGIPHESSKVSDALSVSIGGYTLTPTHFLDPVTVIEKTDRMLYQAKEKGRNRFEWAQE